MPDNDDHTNPEHSSGERKPRDDFDAASSILAISTSNGKQSAGVQCNVCNRVGTNESMTKARVNPHLTTYFRLIEASIPVGSGTVLLCKRPFLCYRGFDNWKKTVGCRVALSAAGAAIPQSKTLKHTSAPQGRSDRSIQLSQPIHDQQLVESSTIQFFRKSNNTHSPLTGKILYDANDTLLSLMESAHLPTSKEGKVVIAWDKKRDGVQILLTTKMSRAFRQEDAEVIIEAIDTPIFDY
ncbi:hypothetical protein HDU77_005977 [Chytriomyces hyalinus]|nr:hypothetical protein HDU77_005977 [Chytriomyces hyalinus]